MMAAHCSKQIVSTHVEVTAELGKGLICRGNLLEALGDSFSVIPCSRTSEVQC
ncbi:hypothetical protein D3C77_621490 [compost metagenome]